MLHTQAEQSALSIEHALATSTTGQPDTPRPKWDSEQLLHYGDEALIDHHGETYRLRRTMTGKLILTK